MSINSDPWVPHQPFAVYQSFTTVCRFPPTCHVAGTPRVAPPRRAPERLRRLTRRERAASRSSLPSQIHCSPSSDGSMGIPPASGSFGPPGSPQPARLSRPTRRGALRLLPPYAPCHALWSLPPSSGFAAAASPRALRASGFAAALRAWQTSPYRDHCDLRMGYPLSCSQILSSSALQRVAAVPNRLS